jgi:hypothetical protein
MGVRIWPIREAQQAHLRVSFGENRRSNLISHPQETLGNACIQQSAGALWAFWSDCMRYAAIRHVLAGGLNCSALTSISPSTKYKKGSTIEYGEPKITSGINIRL